MIIVRSRLALDECAQGPAEEPTRNRHYCWWTLHEVPRLMNVTSLSKAVQFFLWRCIQWCTARSWSSSPAQIAKQTAVLSKIPHSNCCKRVPNWPLRGLRGWLSLAFRTGWSQSVWHFPQKWTHRRPGSIVPTSCCKRTSCMWSQWLCRICAPVKLVALC